MNIKHSVIFLALAGVMSLCAVPVWASTQDRVPTGDDSTSWTPLGGGAIYTEVDDVAGTNDGDTTYMSAASAELYQRLTFSAFSLPASSTVSSVAMTVCAKRASGDGNLQPLLVVNGTSYGGSNQVLTTSYVCNTETWATNPNTGAAWTQADVEGTGAAPIQLLTIRSTDLTSGTIRCTAVYLRATYTAPASSNNSFTLVGVSH